MKNLKAILLSSLFIYVLMFQGYPVRDNRGYEYRTNSLQQCQSWARQGGWGYYCNWN